MQQPYYAETPFERIVDVHWKTPGETGGGGGPDESACGSGWFTFNGYYSGGNGFPLQLTNPPCNMLVESTGVRWNPATATRPPTDNPFMFFIPGVGSRHRLIRLMWQGVVGGGGPLIVGLWIYPNRQPAPPYLDEDGNPPSNPVPFNPTVFADINAHSSGQLPYDGDEIQTGNICTVVAAFAAGSATTGTVATPPLPAAGRADRQYGFPGSPPLPDHNMWIDVVHDCP